MSRITGHHSPIPAAMLDAIRLWYRRRAMRPYVRPWGLSAPILVLLVCLPLLRPLWHTDISETEASHLATIQAIVEHDTLAIDQTDFAATRSRISVRRPASEGGGLRHYSDQPPVFAALLAGSYAILRALGISFQQNLALSTYLLTLIGVTLPVAGAAGLVYRMGRLFELSRPWRASLAMAAIFGSGLISYATVLNAHAPAAALLLASCGCLLHAGMTRRRPRASGWLILAGTTAALAAVFDFSAFVFFALFIPVIFSMRWPLSIRLSGAGWYIFGALPPLALHAILTLSITGDLLPGFLHPEQSTAEPRLASDLHGSADSDDPRPTAATLVALNVADAMIGPHGLLSHFPLLLVGVAGIAAVMHRHWPRATKSLAVVTLAGGLLVIAAFVTPGTDWQQPMFAARWFVLFLPLTVFWAGAWLRKRHHPAIWVGVLLLLAISSIIGIIGAAAPFPPARKGEHTAYAAARYLLQPPADRPIAAIAER